MKTKKFIDAFQKIDYRIYEIIYLLSLEGCPSTLSDAIAMSKRRNDSIEVQKFYQELNLLKSIKQDLYDMVDET